ncbi:MAG: hypothetical protein JSR17_03740 [Proteobacteria bacterium]|nr:hypothetical protein [Pseudomonadota bacterium]
MNTRKLLTIAGAAAGAALAISSGAAIPMVAACVVAGAGAPNVIITVGKLAARAAGRRSPELAITKDDVVTLGLMTGGVVTVAALAPDQQRKDPANYVLAAAAAPGIFNLLDATVGAVVTGRQNAEQIQAGVDNLVDRGRRAFRQ